MKNAKNAKNGKTPDTLYERQLRSGPIGEARATEKQIAWLEIEIGSGSYITYKMPYFASSHDGCVTELVCEVKECKLSNGCATVLRGEKTKPFLQMPVFKLIGNMHYPVIYNGVHKWHFIYNMKSPLIYFLRTHWNILSDISTDWSDAGPHTDPVVAIQDFQPTTYKHEVIANAVTLHLNINEKKNIFRIVLVKPRFVRRGYKVKYSYTWNFVFHHTLSWY